MSALLRVQEAIEAFQKGQMVIMVDDEDRENEGDLVYPSVFSTPDQVNFMATHAKGLICVAINPTIAKRLHLEPMVKNNLSMHETAFTVSVDAAFATTGISTHERDMTIKILANPISQPHELVMPGHIFPLIAKEGGTLVRIGHTEGSVDLCRLAGLAESAVICEIMKEDGSMARRDDLDLFAQKHSLKTLYISDIVEYRLANERLVYLISTQTIDFFGVHVQNHTFEDHCGDCHNAIVFYNVGETANVKVHNVISDRDLLLNQTHYTHLMNAIQYMKLNGGVLLFMDKPKHPQGNIKEYGIGAQILKLLGIRHMRLIHETKIPDFAGLSGFGLDVIETIHLVGQNS